MKENENIESVINQAIAERVFPGCVIGYIKKNGKREIFPFGTYTNESGSREITKNSIFDVASVTKSIPTAMLALKAIEQEKLKLSHKLIDWVPEFTGSFRDQIHIRHLLTQTCSFDLKLSTLKNRSAQGILDAILSAPLLSPPGKSFFYCNTTSILLGLVIERVYNRSLDVLAHEYFFNPLAMDNTCFYPDETMRQEIVPSEIDHWRKRTIQGEVHDESAWVLRSIMTPGSAGLFSTVPDLLNFLEMILHGGLFDSQRIFNTKTILKIQKNYMDRGKGNCGLGWELNQVRYMGKQCSNITIGKTGFTGCVVLCDFKKETGIAFLSNYTYPKRKQNAEAINRLRAHVATVILQQ